MKNPDMKLVKFTTDLYLSPVSLEQPSEFSADAIQPENGGVKEETLVLAASVKPFIDIVWTGVGIMFIGFVLAIVRRRKELDFSIPAGMPAGMPERKKKFSGATASEKKGNGKTHTNNKNFSK